MQIIEKRGLRLSKLTLGTVQLGSAYGIANRSGKPDEDQSFRLLNRAIQGGITCFDTAGAYGDSESVLGRFFSQREKPLFISKTKITADARTKEIEIEREMYNNVQMSLGRLQIEKIPIMMLHNPDILQIHGKTVTSCFDKLIKEGLVDKAGVSFGANIDEQFEQVWPLVKEDLYEVVQIPFNLLDDRLDRSGGLQRLKASEKIVFARSIFLQGLIFLSPGSLPQHFSAASKSIYRLQRLAEGEGLSLAQLAVSYVRDRAEVDSVVIGAETEEQVISNLKLIEGPSLTDCARAQVTEAIGALPEHILNPALWPV